MSDVDDKYYRWVTAYTDGSWSGQQKAGIGVVIRASRHPYWTAFGCPCAGDLDNNITEMRAIIEAVRKASTMWDVIDGVGIRTDSRTSLGVLMYGARPHRRADYRALQEELWAIIDSKSQAQGSIMRLRITWVKGHQRVPSKRKFMNDLADKIAGKARNLKVEGEAPS